tara:strand:- start:865 stop:1086 length:222 start_codon:yes stop_codon:yes gene_type:complete
MGSIFRPKTPPLPPVPPAPEPPEAEISPEEKERIAKEQAAVERRRRGRKSTILTTPLGVQDSEEEKLETLLGK